MLLVSSKLRANIRRILRQATQEEFQAGLRWYEEARAFCAELAEESPYALHEIVCALAAMSPNCSWDRNKQDLTALVRGDANARFQTYPANVDKARQCLKGNIGALSGNKVRSFAECILLPEISRAVTVDTHAYSVAMGIRFTTETVPNLSRIALYDTIANAYRVVANSAKLRPHQLQAITWLTWRRMQGIV